eukprot:g469.t1
MDGRFDDLLLGLAQKHKGIEDLLHTLMTFLERQSDLFHIKERSLRTTKVKSENGDTKGFKEGEAEKMLRKQFSEFQARYLARAQPHLLASMPQRLGGYAAAATSAASTSSCSRSEVPMGINPSPLEGGDPGQWAACLHHN